MIRIENLTKKFGESTVIDDISVEFEEGNIYGFVGRNGSGKTMLLKLILGFVLPTSGKVIIDDSVIGGDTDTAENVGAIIENPGFLPEYSAFKNLKLLAMIRRKVGDDRIRQTLKMVGLDPDSKKHVGKFSLGMKQRLGIAQALMEDPKILLLDEPMNGLDNEGVDEIRKVLLEEKKKGKIIIVASHSKDDISILCDKIYRFEKGRITLQ